MTLEEAIRHAEEKAKRGGKCGEDHAQLAMWLKELQKLRTVKTEKRKEESTQNVPKEDLISRKAAIDALIRKIRPHNNGDGTITMCVMSEELVRKTLDDLPSAQPDKRTEKHTKTHACDCISRQAAISAKCNACGKIDCDKMDKCKKLQLPPANCSEFPNNSDTISRQAAITEFSCCELTPDGGIDANYAIEFLENLPAAQPDIIACGDCIHWICHDRRCGYWNHGVKPLDWCCHAERRTDG